MRRAPKDPKTAAYDVGYGRPPTETQFKPGASGNPKGRPRTCKTTAAILHEVLAMRVTIEEKGRSKKVSVEEIIIRRLAKDAARGDLKATRELFRLRERYQPPTAEGLDPEEAKRREEKSRESFKRVAAALDELAAWKCAGQTSAKHPPEQDQPPGPGDPKGPREEE